MSNSPRTLRRDVRVFISAVTRELGSVRKLVKKGLEDNYYHAVEQDNFPPDARLRNAKAHPAQRPAGRLTPGSWHAAAVGYRA
jgi:hypothetical protein